MLIHTGPFMFLLKGHNGRQNIELILLLNILEFVSCLRNFNSINVCLKLCSLHFSYWRLGLHLMLKNSFWMGLGRLVQLTLA